MLDGAITIDKVSKFMGYASVAVVIDLHGHLLPSGEAEGAASLDGYYTRGAERHSPPDSATRSVESRRRRRVPAG
jgi:hypothetical protein